MLESFTIIRRPQCPQQENKTAADAAAAATTTTAAAAIGPWTTATGSRAAAAIGPWSATTTADDDDAVANGPWTAATTAAATAMGPWTAAVHTSFTANARIGPWTAATSTTADDDAAIIGPWAAATTAAAASEPWTTAATAVATAADPRTTATADTAAVEPRSASTTTATVATKPRISHDQDSTFDPISNNQCCCPSSGWWVALRNHYGNGGGGVCSTGSIDQIGSFSSFESVGNPVRCLRSSKQVVPHCPPPPPRRKGTQDFVREKEIATMIAGLGPREVDLSTTLRVGSTPILERPHKNASCGERPATAPGRKRPRSAAKPPVFRQGRGGQTRPRITTAEIEVDVNSHERNILDSHARIVGHGKTTRQERDLGPHSRILHHEKRVRGYSRPTSALLGASSPSSDRLNLVESANDDFVWSDERGGRWRGWAESHGGHGRLRNGNDLAAHHHGRFCSGNDVAARRVASEGDFRPRPASASTEHARPIGNAAVQDTPLTEDIQVSTSSAASSTARIAGGAHHIDVEGLGDVAAGAPRELLTRPTDLAAFKKHLLLENASLSHRKPGTTNRRRPASAGLLYFREHLLRNRVGPQPPPSTSPPPPLVRREINACAGYGRTSRRGHIRPRSAGPNVGSREASHKLTRAKTEDDIEAQGIESCSYLGVRAAEERSPVIKKAFGHLHARERDAEGGVVLPRRPASAAAYAPVRVVVPSAVTVVADRGRGCTATQTQKTTPQCHHQGASGSVATAQVSTTAGGEVVDGDCAVEMKPFRTAPAPMFLETTYSELACDTFCGSEGVKRQLSASREVWVADTAAVDGGKQSQRSPSPSCCDGRASLFHPRGEEKLLPESPPTLGPAKVPDGGKGPQRPQGPQGSEGGERTEGTEGAEGVGRVERAEGSEGAAGVEGSEEGEKRAEGAGGAEGAEGAGGTGGAEGTERSEGPEIPGRPGRAHGARGARAAQGAQGPRGAREAQESERTKGSEGSEGSERPEGGGGAEGPKEPEGAGGPGGPEGLEGTETAEGAERVERAAGVEQAEGSERPEILQGLEGSPPDTERQTFFSSLELPTVAAAQPSPPIPAGYKDIGSPMLTATCEDSRQPRPLRATPPSTSRASTSGRQRRSTRGTKTARGDALDATGRDGTTTSRRTYNSCHPPRPTSCQVPFRCVAMEALRFGVGDGVSTEDQDIGGASSVSCSWIGGKGGGDHGGGGGGGRNCDRESVANGPKEVLRCARYLFRKSYGQNGRASLKDAPLGSKKQAPPPLRPFQETRVQHSTPRQHAAHNTQAFLLSIIAGVSHKRLQNKRVSESGPGVRLPRPKGFASGPCAFSPAA